MIIYYFDYFVKLLHKRFDKYVMEIIEAQYRFARAQARGVVYSYFSSFNYLMHARQDCVYRNRLRFDGRSLPMPPALFEKMGINPKYFDSKLRVIFLTDRDYNAYSRRKSGGTYLPQPDCRRTIGADVRDFDRRTADARKIVVPEGAALQTLLHETLHDIFHNLLSKAEKDEFIRTAAHCYGVAERFRGVKGLKELPERVLFRLVREHARIARDEVVGSQALAKMKAGAPQGPLFDSLDEKNQAFFDELFSMAGESYFGFNYPLLSGRIPPPVQQFFQSLALRQG